MNMSSSDYSDSQSHLKEIQKLISSMKERCHRESEQLTDSRGRALLETTADVLAGLEKAFQDYLSNTQSWQKRTLEEDFPQKSADPWD